MSLKKVKRSNDLAEPNMLQCGRAAICTWVSGESCFTHMLYASKCRGKRYVNTISCAVIPGALLPGFRMLSSAHLVPTSVRRAQSWICSSSRSFMDLKALLSSLNDFASLSFAESWDNVGLLVEPSPPHTVNTLFLTNDLTEEVMEEALQRKADLILSYHPPVFRPMKHITWNTWKERLVIRALENRIAIYSPHTAYDAAPQGVNSWLAKGLGEKTLVIPYLMISLQIL